MSIPGAVIRVCLINYNNFLVTRRNKKTKKIEVIDGVEKETLKLLEQATKAKMELSVASSVKIKSLDMYGKCLHKLWHNESDFALGAIPAHISRNDIGDPSHSYYNVDIRFFTKLPGTVSNMYNFVMPFSFTVWLMVLASIFVVSLTSYFVSKRKYTFWEQLFSAIGDITMQGPEIEAADRVPTRILSTFWSYSTLLLSLSYMSLILSVMTVPLKEPLIDTSEKILQAVREGRYKIVVQNNFRLLLTKISESPLEAQRELAREIIKHKWNSSFPHYEIPKLIKNRNAVILEQTFQKIFIPRNVIKSKESLHTGPLVLYYNKNFIYKKTFDDVILRIIGGGLIVKSTNDYVFRLKIKIKKYELDEPIEAIKTLTLEDLKGCFLVLGVGLLISLLVFVLELLNAKFRKGKKKVFTVDLKNEKALQH